MKLKAVCWVAPRMLLSDEAVPFKTPTRIKCYLQEMSESNLTDIKAINGILWKPQEMRIIEQNN